MSIYAIGDPHLSFSPNVDKPMDIFGEEWKDHPEKIKKSWLSCVKDDDTVVIAGDISWGLKMDEAMADLEWIDALPGKKLSANGIMGSPEELDSGTGRILFRARECGKGRRTD